MKVCNKCKIDREDNEFEKYWHSTRQQFYIRGICNPCMREGYRQYKFKIKEQERLKDIENNPDYKQCAECMEYKLLDNFYLNAYKNTMKKCRSCYNTQYKKNSDEYNRQRGGSERVMVKPNNYTDIYQKEHVFSVMKAFGWIFDEPTGIWNKPGFKENGVFINIIPTDKPKRKSSSGGGRKLKSGVYNNVSDIIKLLELGHSYKDVAETFCCSHTLIRMVVSKYRNEKRTD